MEFRRVLFRSHRYVISDLNLGVETEILFGKRRDDIDHAARRVASVERALRTTQHLDASEIEKFGFEQPVADEGGVVEADGDRRVGRCRYRLRPDPADREDRKSTRLNSSH